MSRHQAKVNKNCILYYGWDNPLRSYWAYLEDISEPEDIDLGEVIIFDIGAPMKSFEDIECFIIDLEKELDKISSSFRLSETQINNIRIDKEYSL